MVQVQGTVVYPGTSNGMIQMLLIDKKCDSLQAVLKMPLLMATLLVG